MGLNLFLTIITTVLVRDGVSGGNSIGGQLVLPLVGLLIAFLGNYMHSLKPNYFVGIGVPWTLHDEGNWRETHRMASHIWFGGGILLFIAALTLPPAIMSIVLYATIAILTIVPIVYSFLLFRKTSSQKL